MKKIKSIATRIIILTLFGRGGSLTPWFEIKQQPGRAMSVVAVGGPGYEYITQGGLNKFDVYKVDWEIGTPSHVKTIDFPTNSNLVTGFLAGDETHYTFSSQKLIMRLNTNPDTPGGEETISAVSATDGSRYSYAHVTKGVPYVFISSQKNDGGTHLLYRFSLTSISDMKTFTFTGKSLSYGILAGTPWFLISLWAGSTRQLVDYTNGYQGGSNQFVVTHTISHGNVEERGFVSPGDRRGYYVTSDSVTSKLFTSKDSDGSEKLNHDLSAIGGVIYMFSWLADTDFMIVYAYDTKFAIVDFKDEAKSTAPQFVTLPAGNTIIRSGFVWDDKKVAIVGADIGDTSFVYKLESYLPCSDLCVTCDGIFRKKCLSCQPSSYLSPGNTCTCNDGLYASPKAFTIKECKPCSSLCGTCSGGTTADCVTCKYQYMERKVDGTCGCHDGKYLSGSQCLECDSSCSRCSGPGPSACLSCDLSSGRYLSGSTCLACDTSCKSCSGRGSNQCLSCDASKGRYLSGSQCLSCKFGEYPDESGTCLSCSGKKWESCPEPISVSVPSSIKELTQNFTLVLTPSLQDPLLSDFKITAEDLSTKNLNFSYKKKQNQATDPLTIIRKQLTHTQNTSQLFIEFLEKMRVSTTEYAQISFKEPILYKTAPSEAVQKIKYFIKQEYKIPIIEGENVDQEQEEAKENFEGSRIGQIEVGTVASASIITAVLSGMQGSIFTLIRFINISGIISNLGLINIRFGSNLKLIIEYLENFKMFEFDFLSKLSPLKDSKFDDPDVDAYRIKPRGSRGKVTSSNGQIFIISGQNFIVSCLIIGLWALSTSISYCMDKKSKIVGLISFCYQILLGLVFFDDQMISFAEIAFYDYSTFRKWTPKLFLSLMISYGILILIGREFYQGFKLIKENKDLLISESDEDGKKVDTIALGERLVIEKYTEVVNLESYGPHWYFSLMDSLRFSVIQLVIASLQLLNRTQALIVLVIDLVFFHYFVMLACKHDIFRSNYLMDKTIIQECCILMFLITITLFSFTEDSDFSSSLTYKVIEVVAIIGIVGTIVAELIILIVEIYLKFSESCRKLIRSKKKLNSKKSAHILPKETERDSFRPDREIQNEVELDFDDLDKSLEGKNQLQNPSTQNSEGRKISARKFKVSKRKIRLNWSRGSLHPNNNTKKFLAKMEKGKNKKAQFGKLKFVLDLEDIQE